MQRSDFYFDLPEHLIARYPKAQRRDSRLLQLNRLSGELQHRQFAEILDIVQPGDLMVFNNTRVIPARLHGQKASGGKIEVLVERITDNQTALAHVRASKSPKPGSRLRLEGAFEVEVLGRHDALFELAFPDDVLALLERHGHMPLPPYIDRPDEQADRERYQTVYNKNPGAVAAPTAGLHFDQPLLSALRDKGVQIAEVTLHVGAGTFQPVRVDNITEHQMHSEYAEVSAEVVALVQKTKAAGGRVIAVGSTSVRSLESAAAQVGDDDPLLLAPLSSDTSIFIYPGYRFRIVDAMVTNFHLPESTLIMMISAFAGYDAVMNAYHEAIQHEYRFFSYGDAMFIGA